MVGGYVSRAAQPCDCLMAKVLNFYHIGKVIPENAEYMGRAMPHLGLKQSKFANPYKLSKNEPRGATIERYRVWL